MQPAQPHTLAGDERICVRPLEATDRTAYLEGFARLSDETRYLRFASPKPRLTPRELVYLLEVDHDRHEALVAYECASGRAVGVGRYVRDAGAPETAEIALTVLDEWQGQGVGARMLADLSAHAAEHGVALLRADVLRANGRAMRLLRRAGWTVVSAEGLMVTLERPLPSPAAAPAPCRGRAPRRPRPARRPPATAARPAGRSGS
jgi:GNAT superfamily N-acetyltransferase